MDQSTTVRSTARSRRILAACASLSAGLLIAAPAIAGPWTPEEQAAYHKFAVNYFSGDSSFGADQPGFLEFEDLNFTYYGEYGLTDRLALIGSVPLKRISRRDIGSDGVEREVETTGLGDLDIGLRYKLIDGPVVVSVQGVFKAPYLYDQDEALPLGNGQEDFEGRLLIGRSLGAAGYFAVEAGYRFRTDAPVDEFRYLVEYGVDVSRAVYLRAKLDGLAAVGDDGDTTVINGNPTLPIGFDLGRLEGTVGYRVGDENAIEFTVTENLYGDNTLKGTSFQLAFVTRF